MFLLTSAVSLLLGLPYGASLSQSELKAIETGNVARPWGEWLLVKVGIITGDVIDCYHNATFSETLTIDQKFEECKKCLPQGWWEATPQGIEGIEEICNMFLAKCIFHHVRKVLHLPFMLKSFTERRYDFSRIVALESSREMIKCYQILRNEPGSLSTVCNVLDFHVVGVILPSILNIADSSNH